MTDKDREFSAEETERRANAALRRALSTPPKPHKPTGKKKRSRRQREVERTSDHDPIKIVIQRPFPGLQEGAAQVHFLLP
jgi:hypothetical protein